MYSSRDIGCPYGQPFILLPRSCLLKIPKELVDKSYKAPVARLRGLLPDCFAGLTIHPSSSHYREGGDSRNGTVSMRREWLDRIEEIMNKVNSSASAVWDLHEIEELFDLGRETARKIMIAVGRINPDSNCHIETDKLKEFLEEFLTIISAGGNQKNQRRKAIKKATALYREMLAKAMEVEKDAKWEYFRENSTRNWTNASRRHNRTPASPAR
jgi:hypothetical protein